MPPFRRCLLGRGGRRRRHPGRGSLPAQRGRFCSTDQSKVGPNGGSLGGPVAYLSVSLPQASNASLGVGDRSTQLVIHDAMQHRPAHLPNAYSPKCVEEEFCELRLERGFSDVWVCHTRLPQEGWQPSLSCPLHPPALDPPDYPAVPPHERSTSSQRSQVGAASTPWSQAHDQTNRMAL